LPKIQKIVVVSTDLPGLNAHPGIVECPHSWKCLRKESRLHLLCDLQFLMHAPFGFHLLGNCTAPRLDLPADFVVELRCRILPVGCKIEVRGTLAALIEERCFLDS